MYLWRIIQSGDVSRDVKPSSMSFRRSPPSPPNVRQQSNQPEQTSVQMARLLCLMWGLTPHAKHNAWASPDYTDAHRRGRPSGGVFIGGNGGTGHGRGHGDMQTERMLVSSAFHYTTREAVLLTHACLLSAGLHGNYRDGFHETWRPGGARRWSTGPRTT